MTALLVLFTFVLIAGLDYVLSRRKVTVPALAPVTQVPAAAPEPVFVAGYKLPEDLHYHFGHTWARPIGPDLAVVGIDDFASKLAGRAKHVKLPAPGTWLPMPLGRRLSWRADPEGAMRPSTDEIETPSMCPDEDERTTPSLDFVRVGPFPAALAEDLVARTSRRLPVPCRLLRGSRATS